MSAAEIGVSLSHISLWQTIATVPNASHFDLACIFEDDLLPHPLYAPRLSAILTDLSNHTVDLLYLYYNNFDPVNSLNISENVIRPRMVNGAAGYCLSKSGAGKLVESLPVTDSVDDWMGFTLVPNSRINAYAARNQNIVSLDGSASPTIDHWSDDISTATLDYLKAVGIERNGQLSSKPFTNTTSVWTKYLWPIIRT